MTSICWSKAFPRPSSVIRSVAIGRPHESQPGTCISEAARRFRSALQTARKRAKARPERFAGDPGTPEIKLRQKVLIEARQRSLKGEPTVVRARVEAQFPHDRYRVRNQLDPSNSWPWPGYSDGANGTAESSNCLYELVPARSSHFIVQAFGVSNPSITNIAGVSEFVVTGQGFLPNDKLTLKCLLPVPAARQEGYWHSPTHYEVFIPTSLSVRKRRRFHMKRRHFLCREAKMSINIKPSHKGRLHRALGVSQDRKLTMAQIKKAEHSRKPAVRREVQFAANFRKK